MLPPLLLALVLALAGSALAVDADLRALDDGQGGGPGYRFDPARLAVAPGETLQVTNEGQEPHTVSHDAEQGSRLFDVQNLQPGETRDLRAPREPGEYPFKCVYHPEMTGVLVVEPRAPPEGTTPTEGATPTEGEGFDPAVGIPPIQDGNEPVPGPAPLLALGLVGALAWLRRR